MLTRIPEEYKNHPLGQLAMSYQNEIEENYDARDKIVGDRVNLWNVSGCCDENCYPVDDENIINKVLIVIEAEIKNKELRLFFMGEEYSMKLDLLLYDPTSMKKYRATSELCKIIDGHV